uniref:Uncharacterized protein n=1 Tax=Oryza glumipatula TaxID=40148 RepID=A0A0D9YG21_9ORYZ
MLPGDPSSSLLCRFRLPRRPSRLTASEESIEDKNRWLNNHFNSRWALDFSVLHQAVTEATRPLCQGPQEHRQCRCSFL